ncbi:hypothetical protein [Microbispora sp. NPDC049125]|uniref:methylation-associated defense system restriction endonuclease subunit S MAD5 n=1 Tax=Microbispora sp. NPDC049125 TaxID=3154929 RepID=UPI0034679A56
MKLVDPNNPVRASWLAEQGFRLDPGPYISEAYAARMFLKRVARTDALEDVAERIFHPGRALRSYITNREHGTPFLGSADIFESDLSFLPLVTKSSVRDKPSLLLEPGWTLITRSGMTAGRVTYVRPQMSDYVCSEHVIRVVPAPDGIPAGYLYTFLASPFGIPIIKGGIYGTSVKHIEPSHIMDLPVPRVGDEIERRIDALISEAMELRARFQTGIVDATQDLFKSAGLPELLDLHWHDQPRDLDFSVSGIDSISLRALNYSPRARRLIERLQSVSNIPLGEICAGGSLRTGARFKRTDAGPANGVRLVGQRQAFWMRPSGRWINPRLAPADIRPADETILVAAHGTLGETEVYGRSILITGKWLEYAFSQDFLRVLSGTTDFPGAYLFAFFRSEMAFRVLRSMSVGGKQQEYHPALLRALPIPTCTPSDRERIAETVREAFRLRDEADVKEDQALELLNDAVREAAR